MANRPTTGYCARVRTDDWDRQRFQSLLQAIQERTGLSDGDMGELAGRSRSQINRWTRAESQPTYQPIRQLAEALATKHPNIASLAGQLLIAAGYEGESDLRTEDDWWMTTPPPDLRVGTDWEALPPETRWLWHTPGLSASVRWKLTKFVQAEQEAAEVDASIRNGVHSPAEIPIIKGANGA